jgi:hypothetical protein
MKAQHRHQLQTNVLADRMGRLLQGMKSSPTSTSVLIWVFVVLALGTFGVWQYYAQATQTERSALWVQVDGALHNPEKGPGELARIEAQQKGTIPGRAAGFEIARAKFQAAQGKLSSEFERTEAIKRLTEAQKLYQELAGQCADAPELAQEALMAVAKADESLIGTTTPDNPQEDLDRAVQAYQSLAEKFPWDSAKPSVNLLGRAAAERAKELQDKSSEVLSFYQELNKLAERRNRSDSSKDSLPPLPGFPEPPKIDPPGK